MRSKLVMGFGVEALDGCILEGPVHPLDLAVGPGGLGQTMIDVVASAGDFEGRSPEGLAKLKHAFDIGDRPTFALGIGEVGSIVG